MAPLMTTINNPAGTDRVFAWAYVNFIIDLSSKQITVKITGRDDPNDVWFEGTVDGFIDHDVSDVKGIQLTMGRANGNQEIDNIKIKQY